MKKLFVLVLALLTLCGCGTEPPAPTTGETTPATEEVIIDHDALELLEFDYENVYAATPMGDDLLLFSGTARDTTLIKLDGRNYKELATISTNARIEPDDPAVAVSETGVCYATEEAQIFLDENLEEVERVTLPGAWGTGIVAADQQRIFYSTGSELRVYNRETGLDRLLRDITHTTLALDSLELNDSVLVCRLLDHSAVSPTLFYSAETGELLGTCDSSISLESAGALWLAEVSEQTVFGTGATEPQTLTAMEGRWGVTAVDNGILIDTENEDGFAIRFLDLTNNTETALPLDGAPYVTNAWREAEVLWFSLNDGRLYRWELADTETQAASCIAPYYTRENPDTAGLAALEPTIAALETTYGVRIHIAEDAIAAQPATDALVSEYRVDALTAGLDQLSAALSRFSPEFLKNAGKASDDGTVHLCLVRSVEDGCVQFWDDDGNARIALAVDENVAQHFYHGLAHIIDARVMSESAAFDNWERLNPKGFDYDYDYAANETRDGSEYADAFIDTFAMSFPTEDRARIFEYAMLEDQADAFASETMQKKLSTLCAAIRKAFGLQDSGDPLPWEQYLAE